MAKLNVAKLQEAEARRASKPIKSAIADAVVTGSELLGATKLVAKTIRHELAINLVDSIKDDTKDLSDEDMDLYAYFMQ